MNQKKCFLSLIYILFITQIQAQWTVPPCPVPGLTYEDAPLLDCCLDGYSYQTDANPNVFTPPGFCGTGENGQWLAFRATYSGIIFQFDVSNCIGSQQPPDGGLQFQVYGIGDFCQENLLFPIGDCFSPMGPTSGQISALGLTPGHVYYIFIDGWSGDICDYTISILDTIDPVQINAPSLSGPSTVGVDQTATFTLDFPNLDNHNPCGNYKQDPVPCGCIDPNPANITWSGPSDATISPIPNTFSANVTFGSMSGDVCIFVSSLCGTYQDCIFVNVENLCADAGEDQYICGFSAQLSGSPLPGDWEFLCDISDGLGTFSGGSFNPGITVSNCGNYYFEYTSLDPNCMDVDTVLVSFEDPSHRETQIFMDIGLDYVNVKCHEGAEAEPCENTVTIPGLPPPVVAWEFCTSAACESVIFSNEIFGSTGCLADSILIETDTINDATSNGCVNFGQDHVLNNFFDIIDSLAGGVFNDLGCPLAPGCFIPEIIDSIIVIDTISLPKREGGQWHIVLPTEIIPANNQTFFIYNNKDFVLNLSPDETYYGPGDIELALFEITNFGDTIYQTIQVDFQMQWIEEWSYVQLTRSRKLYLYEDSHYDCPGNSILGPAIVIPPPPTYPCGPIDVSFPPYDCELCPVDMIIDAHPDFFVLDCCNPCVNLVGTGSSSEGNVSIRWSNGQSTMLVCQGGSYTVTVTSLPSGCTAEKTVTIFEDFYYPDVFILPPDEITCLNPCVQLETVVSGIQFNLIYYWTGPNGFNSNDPSPTVCEPGTYSVNVFDFNNCCEAWADVNVVEFIEPEIIEIQDVICPGECYVLNGESFCNQGLHTQNGVDQNSCPTVTNLTLDFHNVPVGNVTMTLCESEVYVYQNSGNIYDIGNPTGTEIEQSYLGCDSLVNIQIDFYTPENQYLQVELCVGECYDNAGMAICTAGITPIDIVDGNGCDAILEIDITILTQQTSNFNKDLCEDELIEINLTIYNQANPTGTEIFQDLNGCDSLVFIQINTLQTQYQFINEIVCEGECYDLNGQVYCDAGVYIQNSQGSNGCKEVIELTLSNHIPQSSNIEMDLCQSESIVINGTIYDENNPTGTEIFQDMNGCDSLVFVQTSTYPTEYQFISQTVCEGACYDLNGETFCDAGVYFQSIQSLNACEGFIELTLSNFQPQSSDLNQNLCEGESIQINGTIYDDNNPTGTEIYSDVNGCDSLVFIQIITLPTEYNYSTEEICQGACFDWFGQQICTAGTYSHTETGQNGCDVVNELNVDELPTSNSIFATSLCTGDQMIINGTIYDESNPSGQEIFIAQNGCDSTVNIDLNFVNLSSTTALPNMLTCLETTTLITTEIQADETIQSTIWTTSNGSIITDPNQLEITVNAAGDYQLEIITESGCSELNIISVEENMAPPIPIVTEALKLDCNSNEVKLICDNNNMNYEWSGPGIDNSNQPLQNPTISLSGDYTLIITNPINGCSEVANVTVSDSDVINFEAFSSPSCGNSATGKIELFGIEGGQQPYNFSINGNEIQDPNIGFSAGIYTLEIEDANGCLSSQDIEITERPELEILNEETIQICGIQEIQLEANINFPNEVLSYTWDDGTKIPFRIITEEGTYSLTVQNECEVLTHEFEVIDNEFSIRNKIYVPNAFSANGDAINDVFQAYTDIDLTEFEFMVFDRWGNLVFETDDPSKGWDGKTAAKRTDSAVFVWMIHAKGSGCDDRLQEVVLRGDVVLMK